ncbi:MAG: protein translocase subunit SecF [Acidimicrobiales bacterium]
MSSEQNAPPAEKASLRHRLYHGETHYDFVGRRWWWFAFSAVVIMIGVVALLTDGLNYGIDFKGGTSWEVGAPGVSVAEARDAVAPLGLGEAKIQIAGGGLLRVQALHQSPENQVKVTEKLAELAKTDPNQVSVNDVGPSGGKDVTKKARTALIVFFVLISIYIALRFEWKMTVAAMAAVVHDILVTVGVYALSRFEVTPATVVAFLTILGYSLYDTVVVFDKVEENAKATAATGRTTYSDVVNMSMNEVLMRSINTSFVAIMPVLSVLVIGWGVMGAIALKDFGLALLIGLLTGAYSSIFIASPILAMIKEREPRYAMIRQRAMSKAGSGPLVPGTVAGRAGGRGGAKAPKGGPAIDDDEERLVPAGDGAASRTAKTATVNRPRPAKSPGSRQGAPRPRKKGKKR